MNRKRPVRIATLATAWHLDEGISLKETLALLQSTARQHEGLDLVTLPLLFAEGTTSVQWTHFERACARIARRHRFHLAYALRRKQRGHWRQTAVLLNRQGLQIASYRQVHRLPWENHRTGKTTPVIRLDFGNVALKIGSDVWFPELDEVYALHGGQFIVWHDALHPVEDQDRWVPLLRARAIGHRTFHIRAACAPEKGFTCPNFFMGVPGEPVGRSCVVDPWGHFIADTGSRQGTAIAECDSSLADGSCRLGAPRTITLLHNRRGVFAPLAQSHRPPRRSRARRTRLVLLPLKYEQFMEIPDKRAMDGLMAELRNAARSGGDMVVLPESGYWDEKKTEGQIILKEVSRLAKRHGVWMAVGGFLHQGRQSGLFYDRHGRLARVYDRVAYGGDPALPLETDFGRVAMALCCDLWTEELWRLYGLWGTDLVLWPAQSWGRSAIANRAVLQARAIENSYYIAHTNFPTEEARHRSEIIDPWGHTLVASGWGQSGPVVCDVDLANKPPAFIPSRGKVRRIAGYPEGFRRSPLPRRNGNLLDAILRSRRPDLYRAIIHPPRQAPIHYSDYSNL